MSNQEPRSPFEYVAAGAVRIVFTDRNQWHASGLFNPNEYPETAKQAADNAASALRRVLSFGDLVLDEIRRAKVRGFNNDIRNLREVTHIPIDSIVHYQSWEVIAAFESFAIALRAMLDALTRLTATKFKGAPGGFNKSNDVVGGRLIEALRGAPVRLLPGRDELLRTIVEHKARWIDDVVSVRDDIVHKGSSPRMHGFWTFLPAGSDPSTMAPYEVHDPELLRLDSSTVPLDEFARQVITDAQHLAELFRDAAYPPRARAGHLAGQ